MKNTGFTLIEFIIYIALFSFIAMIFLGVASRAQLRFMRNTLSQETLLRQELAIDLLRRDLMSASANFSNWDVEASVFRQFTLNDKNLSQVKDICWVIGNQGLMRASGQYDFENRRWISRSACIVCKSIKQFKFVLQKREHEKKYYGVWVIYNTVDSKLEKKIFVRFRNRVVA